MAKGFSDDDVGAYGRRSTPAPCTCNLESRPHYHGPTSDEALGTILLPDPTSKDTNPKDGLGALKLPLHLVPVTAIAYASIALHNGRGKYGAHNWTVAGVRASIYLDALDRHMKRWIDGEEVDPEDGVPNLAGAMACLCILIDARARGKLTDDRPPSFNVAAFFDALTPLVVALNHKHAERHPRHHTIADTETKP